MNILVKLVIKWEWLSTKFAPCYDFELYQAIACTCWWAYRKLYPPETPYSLITKQTTFFRQAYKDSSIQDLT